MVSGLKRRRILLLLALAAVAAAIALFWPRGPKEPVYQGKRLSQWLAETNQWSKWPAELTREARNAIQEIGTNAFPYLLYEFERRDSKWLAAFKQNKFVSRTLNLRSQPNGVRLSRVKAALSCLGPELAPVLPRLARHLDDPERGMRALELFHDCGEAGTPYLFRGLYSNDPKVVRYAISYLCYHRAAAESAIPRFIQLAEHRDPWVRHMSLVALRSFPSAANSTVPVLRRALADATPEVSRVAADALGMLGADAKSAVPDLLPLLSGPDAYCALLASNALFRIDPAVLPPRGP